MRGGRRRARSCPSCACTTARSGTGTVPSSTPPRDGHLRIELRALPAGSDRRPTCSPSAAFLLGLILDLAPEMPRPPARASRSPAPSATSTAPPEHGLAAELLWPLDPGRSRRSRCPRRELTRLLVDRARRGLRSAGVDEREIAQRLDVFAARVDSGMTGAVWQRRHARRDRGERSGATRRCTTMLEQYVAHAATGQPVHTWPLDDAVSARDRQRPQRSRAASPDLADALARDGAARRQRPYARFIAVAAPRGSAAGRAAALPGAQSARAIESHVPPGGERRGAGDARAGAGRRTRAVRPRARRRARHPVARARAARRRSRDTRRRVVVGRLDMVFTAAARADDEPPFSFLELNADSPAGIADQRMLEDDALPAPAGARRTSQRSSALRLDPARGRCWPRCWRRHRRWGGDGVPARRDRRLATGGHPHRAGGSVPVVSRCRRARRHSPLRTTCATPEIG